MLGSDWTCSFSDERRATSLQFLQETLERPSFQKELDQSDRSNVAANNGAISSVVLKPPKRLNRFVCA